MASDTAPFSAPRNKAPERELPFPACQHAVITVCWNALADLKPTVESVVRQKARGSISIGHVVDGASADGTPEWLAKQLAAEYIERYVSEPDRGIYGAMNKGINLARGKVLAVVNAGDTYRADADLAACVLPLCRGETESMAASAHVAGSARERPLYHPQNEQMYVLPPCCRQAFFAPSAPYREMGGYDSQTLHCAADTDLMYRAHGKARRPLLVDNVEADFQAGVISADCYAKFRDEFIELLWCHRDGVKERCRTDRHHQRLIMATLYGHCTYLATDAAARMRACCTVLCTVLAGMLPKLLPEFHSFLFFSSPILV